MKFQRIMEIIVLFAGMAYSEAALACKVENPCRASGSDWSGKIVPITCLLGLAAYRAWQYWNRIDPVLLERDDPDVIAAKAQARATLDKFWRAFNAQESDYDNFAIKAELPELPSGGHESVWLTEISNRNGKIFGRISNETVHPDFHEGQMISIELATVDDWMYTDENSVHGHFLTRVMIAKSPKRTGRKMMKAYGWSEADLQQSAGG